MINTFIEIFQLKKNCLLTSSPIYFIMPSKFSIKIYIYSIFYIWFLKRHGYQVLTKFEKMESGHLCTWGSEFESKSEVQYASQFKSITLLEQNNCKSLIEILNIFIKKAEEDFISGSLSYK